MSLRPSRQTVRFRRPITDVTDKLVPSRRHFIKQLVSGASLLALNPIRKASAAPIMVNVTLPPFSADFTGQTDCSLAFQRALGLIQSAGSGWGGKLWIPTGVYKLAKPLVCNGSLIIDGDGQSSTILQVLHSGAALTVNCSSNTQNVAIRNIGFSPVSENGSPLGTALSLNFPPNQSGWQQVTIEDVDLGAALPGYTVFGTGIYLNNCWRGGFRNINMHSNIGAAQGTSFVSLNGECIDNVFTACIADGVDNGFLMNSYGEGLHLTDCTIIGNTGISTGSTSYNGAGGNGPPINLLGLYIIGGEFSCTNTAANLFQVNGGSISGTHFGTNSPGTTINLTGTRDFSLSELEITGAFIPSQPQQCTGIYMTQSSGRTCQIIDVDDCKFSNLLTGLVFGSGVQNCSALGMRMAGPADESLVTTPVRYGSFYQQPVVNSSGNSTNYAECISGSGRYVLRN